MSLITEQHIVFALEGSTQKEILHALAEIAFREGKVSDADTFFQELCKREQECTTGFGKGIAIPHARHACVKEAGILFVRMQHRIEWQSIDQEPVEAAVCLLAPDDKNDFHLRALSKLARRLMHDDFVEILKTAEKEQILMEILDTVS